MKQDCAASAVISADGLYRYYLRRDSIGNGDVLPFVMLNPSTADASIDDPTIRKCKGFAERLGYSGIEVVNLFAFRATKPADLKLAGYPVGVENDFHIERVGYGAKQRRCPVILAWGAQARGLDCRVKQVEQILKNIGASTSVLTRLSDGTPAHPLMLPYSVVAHG